MDYNRVVKDLNGYTQAEFLQKIGEKFEVSAYEGEGAFHPEQSHTFGLYLGGKWYRLAAKAGTFPEGDPVASSMYPFCRRTCLALCSASVTRARINVLTLSAAFAAWGAGKARK